MDPSKNSAAAVQTTAALQTRNGVRFEILALHLSRHDD
jgi:hypothetical protein